MADREKVIDHLQIMHTWATFALEKDKNFFNEKHMKSIAEWTDDALALLKEQEAKQVIRRQCKTEHPDGSIDYYAEWFCPHCNSLLKRGFDAAWIEYCFKCGKPILWEGR